MPLQADITEGFDRTRKEWRAVDDQTTSKISSMKTYYTNVERRYDTEFENKKNKDRKDLKTDLDRHADLAARASGLKRDLSIQVQSSENHLQRMTKHGKLAALGFAVICAIIGGVIGSKVPGLAQIPAIVVGAVLGFFVCGGLGLALYFVLKWRAKAKRDALRHVQSKNQQSMELDSVISKKRSDLSEICNQLNDIEEGNMARGLPALARSMEKY